MKTFVLLIVGLLVVASQANAQTAIFDATADATIYSELVNNNGGGHSFGIAGVAQNGNQRRLLLDFDLSSIAPGSVINSASLSVTINQANSGGNFELYRVDTDWNEGNKTGNQGALASVGEVTWNEAQNGLVDWTDGGSFFPLLLSQTPITSTGTSAFNTSSNFISAVQSIVDDPSSNFGFIVLGPDEGSASRFDTIDQGVPARLSIEFTTVSDPLLGDFDSDGDVDADDIDFYNGNLGQPASFDAQLDLDNDGTITLADHDLHVMTLVQTSNGEVGALIGDSNLDGSVDVLGDAFLLIGNLGSVGSVGYADGDLNADGTVDVLGDAFRLIGNLGLSNTQ